MAGIRRRAVLLIATLVTMNLLIWFAVFLAFRHDPLLLGTALLAYSFGLRHAWDADHIAAIDNATRKLIQQGQRPLLVGFYFSLGHSTVVILLSAAIVVAAPVVESHFPQLRAVSEIIGTSVSSAFLLLIALINLLILVGMIHSAREIKAGKREPSANSAPSTFLTHLLRSAIRIVDRSWKMYVVGFLFGLGFDTATEIGILGLSATTASASMPTWVILFFPVLFTAGMCLMDTADGILMIGVYSWSCATPLRRLYYNLLITTISVLMALVVGLSQLMNLLVQQLHLQGPIWTLASLPQKYFGLIGIGMTVSFLLLWLASAAVYRFNKARPLPQPSPALPDGISLAESKAYAELPSD